MTCGREYVDLWRITMISASSRHTEAEVAEMLKALDWAKKTGRARFTGISSHDRPHIKMMIEKYPDQLDVIVTPYTSKTKVVEDKDGLWAAMKKCDVGWFGIKPYSSGKLFKGKAFRTIPTGMKTAGLLGWRSATSSATRPSLPRSPA